ncbi:NAD(P)-binding domain-containing protein [Bradyrhizobium zhanjiangense]|uniref:NAD(P)/FAD-dependent oxidoreductase n=1 Tax=Bradyrhizobium zhanjiangense TaxID=1325107 RepID=A0ABY0DMQ3_9BRAD|nr:NAD(P)-binding domain-containing protein [Bradyrhizobium zhanjiangense]RXG96231.1 NAD(P)/FAD-dependent oxidoreductase [Bradyrhizobium zhanjiangense]
MDAEVAIIGAGPYGLAVAAHLQAAGVDHLIFGYPMEMWRRHMPEGMLLKSDGFASNLYDPKNAFPLSRFCSEHSIEYSDTLVPVRLKTFIDYGMAFQERFAPALKETMVHSLRQHGNGFEFDLENGGCVRVRRVVLATGIGQFRYLPAPLAALETGLVSHSYDHHDLGQFAGRSVAVIGGGASAIDLAALLKECGSDVTLICRRENLVFANPPSAKESLWQRIRRPRSGIGPGLKSRMCTDAPLLFHFMPDGFRGEVVRRHLGPAAGWPMKVMFDGRVPVLSGRELVSASVSGGRVRLELRSSTGDIAGMSVDHVIAATGYRTDVGRLNYLDQSVLSRLAHVNEAPRLSTRFESSLEGLFFVGPVAANSFGPMLRFAFGAGFASQRLLPSLCRSLRRSQEGWRRQVDAWAER